MVCSSLRLLGPVVVAEEEEEDEVAVPVAVLEVTPVEEQEEEAIPAVVSSPGFSYTNLREG